MAPSRIVLVVRWQNNRWACAAYIRIETADQVCEIVRDVEFGSACAVVESIVAEIAAICIRTAYPVLIVLRTVLHAALRYATAAIQGTAHPQVTLRGQLKLGAD